MKKQPEITVHMQEELLKKFLYVSKAEGRTPNNQIIFILKNNIQYFERTKGKIPTAALQGIDISEYMKDEE